MNFKKNLRKCNKQDLKQKSFYKLQILNKMIIFKIIKVELVHNKYQKYKMYNKIILLILINFLKRKYKI